MGNVHRYVTVMSLCLLLSFVCADETWMTAVGKGSSRQGAIVHAYHSALLTFLENNLENEVFSTHRDKLVDFVTRNWRQYCNNADETLVERPYEDNSIQILVSVNGEALLQDIEQNIIRSQHKKEGMSISIFIERSRGRKDKDTLRMLDKVQDVLGKHFIIVNKKASRELARAESRFLGQHPQEKEVYRWEKYGKLHVSTYFWLRIRRINDRAMGKAYEVEVGANGLHKATAQEIFRFSHRTVAMSAREAVVRAGQEVAEKVLENISGYNTILPEQVYILKFVDFQRKQDRDNINRAILDLEQQKFLRLLKGGGANGPGEFFYRAKWLRHHSQFEIITILFEQCETNNTILKCRKFAPGMMYFSPYDDSYSKDKNYRDKHENRNSRNDGYDDRYDDERYEKDERYENDENYDGRYDDDYDDHDRNDDDYDDHDRNDDDDDDYDE